MSEVTLLLGPVVFKDFELPANISFGGEQRLAVHKLLGGARVIDTLGRDDSEIAFCGIFSGDDATLRARALDALRAQGMKLPLTWDVFFYTVVIRSFEADYRSGWWIPYRIACTVLRDEAGALIGNGLSLATSVLSDVGSAVGEALAGGLDFSPVQDLLGVPESTTRGTAAFGAAQAGLQSARSSLSANVSSAEANFVAASNHFSAANSAQTAVASLNGATAGAQQLGALAAARGYLGRAALNLANASS